MESLNETDWDCVIAGTGLYQSLLVLALSRLGKKILHIDTNEYYGGPEAALSLQEAAEWVKRYGHVTTSSSHAPFGGATLNIAGPSDDSTAKLSFSRAYSLALAPQLIYTNSRLLKALVASKVYRQLDFLAMGSWWIFSNTDNSPESEQSTSKGRLIKVPTSREDVAFADSSIDLRSKRLVMKVLRFVMDFENQSAVWEPFVSVPLADFLVQKFKLPPLLVNLFLGLSLSTDPPSETSTGFALPRVARHLRSIGLLGEGFSAVIPKWGGLSEIIQVSCRAGAVGGAVYMLGTGITSLKLPSDEAKDGENQALALTLSNNDKVSTKVLVDDGADSPILISPDDLKPINRLSRSVFIISSTLQSIFTSPSEGSPPPAGSVVITPTNSIGANTNPIYLFIHSSDTGECPSGQSVIYCSTKFSDAVGDKALLQRAVTSVLSSIGETSTAIVLWSMYYWQNGPKTGFTRTGPENLYTFPHSPLDLAFDDTILDSVETIWRQLNSSESPDVNFLAFDDRAGEVDDSEEP